MAPAFRSGSGGPVPAVAADDEGMVSFGNNNNNGSAQDTSGKPSSRQQQRATSSSMWDRRRRRIEKKNKVSDEHSGKNGRNRRSNSRSAADEADDDVDPYDSDPGESYRQHCMKMNGIGTKTCLGVPGFLKGSGSHSKSKSVAHGGANGEGETVLTAPPSPMQSELGDLFGQTPASLPANLQRVRYSLRSSITDGSEKQPTGPTVMERRELRPNSVHINVSHWSDTGGRPYMEDR